MTGFTPEEWRTAARVARRSIFTEGNPDLADAWEKAADQAEARLVPAGGMALTAEQVEDVRALVWLDGRRNFDAFYRLRVLFPATEPAEEETKAEPSTRQIADVIVEGRSQNMSWMQIAEMVKQVFFPVSSPVVPAPTETGPWQRIEDVPETVGRLTDRDGDIWEWDGDNWVTPETAILPTAYINKHFAPFVAAAEEG